MAIESDETSPDHANDPNKSPVPEIPEELQKELDSPIKEYRPTARARRSRPFALGTANTGPGRQSRSPTQDLQSPTHQPTSPLHSPFQPTSSLPHSSPSTPRQTENSVNQVDTPSAIQVNGPSSLANDIPDVLSIGPTIRLSHFQLSPSITVSPEWCLPFKHPGSVKNSGILTCRESFHEFLPRQPGEHGILYLDSPDLPKYLVRIRSTILVSFIQSSSESSVVSLPLSLSSFPSLLDTFLYVVFPSFRFYILYQLLTSHHFLTPNQVFLPYSPNF